MDLGRSTLDLGGNAELGTVRAWGVVMLKILIGAVSALVLCVSGAHAQTSLVTPYPGYTYYNRPHAVAAEHDAELRTCIGLASRLVQPDPSAGAGGGGGLLGALVVGVVRGIQQGMAARRGLVANTTNCMVLNGWRLVQIDEALGAELSALDQAALAMRLAPMIGAAEPPGVIVRTFHNEAATRDVIAFGPAGDLDKIPLSILALAAAEEAASEPEQPVARGERLRRPRSAASPRPLSARQLAELAPDSTLVVVNIAGTMGTGGTALSFSRIGDGAVMPGYLDGLPDHFVATLPQPAFASASRPQETTRVFQVPPGRWRLSGIGHTLWWTDFCFGAPFFEIAAGEVVFIRLDLLADERVPVFSAQHAAAALAGLPAHILQRARAATFTNGAASTCGGSSAFYSWEIPGAPFLESYALGSRYRSLRPSVAPEQATDAVDVPALAEGENPAAALSPTDVHTEPGLVASDSAPRAQ